jgi:hypothetical protein
MAVSSCNISCVFLKRKNKITGRKAVVEEAAVREGLESGCREVTQCLKMSVQK